MGFVQRLLSHGRLGLCRLACVKLVNTLCICLLPLLPLAERLKPCAQHDFFLLRLLRFLLVVIICAAWWHRWCLRLIDRLISVVVIVGRAEWCGALRSIAAAKPLATRTPALVYYYFFHSVARRQILLLNWSDAALWQLTFPCKFTLWHQLMEMTTEFS